MDETIKALMALWKYHNDKPLVSFLYDVVFSRGTIRYSDKAIIRSLKRLLDENQRVLDVEEADRI